MEEGNPAMLVLMCEAGGSRCAIRAREVGEVLPAVRLQPVAGAPDWLAGLFVFRGSPTPVVDLAALVTGGASPARWSSRIVLTETSPRGDSGLVGILVDRVTTADLDEPKPGDDGGGLSGPGGLGRVLVDQFGMLQLVDLSRLITPQRRAVLFSSMEEADEPNG